MTTPPPGPDPDQLIPPGEAARRLGVTTTTLGRWADQGLISARRSPTGVRRYLASEVDRLVADALQAGRGQS